MSNKNSNLFPDLDTTLQNIGQVELTEDRKSKLQPLINYIQSKTDRHEVIRLNFICTHNSRRSHLAQVWAQACAAKFAVAQVYCFSGGTEATAMYPMVGETLKSAGFSVVRLSDGKNPIYSIKHGPNDQPSVCFSKTYDDPFNPQGEFAAVMTCAQADADCPFVGGAEARISLGYDDPKAFDDTPQKAAKYAERSLQIAAEMAYVFSKIKLQR